MKDDYRVRRKKIFNVMFLLMVLSIACLADAASLKPGDILAFERANATPIPGIGKVVSIDPLTGEGQIISSGGFLIDPTDMAVSPTGEIYVTNDNNADRFWGTPGTTGDALIRIDPSSGAQTLVSEGGLLANPYALSIDLNGDLLVAVAGGSYTGLIRVDPVSGAQTSYDIANLPYPSALRYFGITQMAMEPAGTLLVFDRALPSSIHRIDLLTGADIGSCKFGGGNYFGLLAVDTLGNITVTDSNPILQSGLPPSILRLAAVPDVPPGNDPPLCLLSTISAGDPFQFLAWNGLAVGEGGTVFVANAWRLYQVNSETGVPTLIPSDFYKGSYIEIYNYTVPPTASVPAANAGPAQTVHVGLPVILDGSGSSDPSGNIPLTFAWKVIASPPGSNSSLSNPNIVTPSFTPDIPGDYTIQLVVTNSVGIVSAPATLNISTTNTAPIADAGPDQPVTAIGSIVNLDGSQSYDADGDPISYSWVMLSKPANSSSQLISSTSSKPSFVADLHGDYVIQLTTSDSWATSTPDNVTVSFQNVKPVAVAGTGGSIPVGVVVCLNGSGSSDANNDPLTYSWGLTSMPANSSSAVSSPTAAVASFVPDMPGTYVAQLVVNDGIVTSDPSTIQFQAVSTESSAITSIQDVQSAVASIPVDSLKNANMMNALTNKLNAAIANIDSGLYTDALAQLRDDILKKTDGCANTSAPDKNDWITTCEEQNKIYPLVQETIWIVEGLLAP